ncbi:hypothetical protein H2200_005474 [Cladophialophora chaetospira]|uniref:Uncharacterized protein n=1 Tax=Cladophialophora chaetospira TaxID=386627 RepID=A0AA39CJM5_9EURO|nr:hypothetical protein H2200_005474 [Cladophialophora chaetospira]
MATPSPPKPPGEPNPPTLMSIPVELRLKVYEILSTDIKITYTMLKNLEKDSGLTSHGLRPPIVPRTCSSPYPYAILAVCKQICREAKALIEDRPVNVEFRNWISLWIGPSLLKVTKFDTSICARIRSITTDDPNFPDYVIKSLSDWKEIPMQLFTNLLSMEFQGRPKDIAAGFESMFEEGELEEPITGTKCARIVERSTWVKETNRLVSLIRNRQPKFVLRSKVNFYAWTRQSNGPPVVSSWKSGILVLDDTGMKITDIEHFF